MELGLKNRRVIVAGASRGIGLAIATAFLREGARVALVARDPARLNAATQTLGEDHGADRIIGVAADCAAAGAWAEVIHRIKSDWGGLDIAVACAGDGRGPRDALPDADRFRAAWRENFDTAEVTTRAVLPLMESGALLFISSIAGVEAIGAPTDYSVAKAAVIALAKQLARRLAPRIRVNTIAPGNVLTPGGTWDEKRRTSPDQVDRMLRESVPLGRLGTGEEIADAAVFLCSDRAAFITGACLIADGGQTVGMH